MLQTFNRHRFLLEELVKRDFKKKYKRSVLGMAWSLLNPLMSLVVMRVVFTRLLGSGIEHYTTYLFCGNIIFSGFCESTTEGMVALFANAGIFSKVNIPKYVFLISKNVQSFINFCATLLVFFVLCAFDGIAFTWKFLMLIYPVVMLFVFDIGVGLVLSAMYVFFRDIQYLWTIVTQLLMYISAIFYSVELFPESTRALFMANPLYVFISYFRQIVIDGVIPSAGHHLLLGAFSALALGLGLAIYKKFDNEFLYYI